MQDVWVTSNQCNYQYKGRINHWPVLTVLSEPVSYTHLDVYKRQTNNWITNCLNNIYKTYRLWELLNINCEKQQSTLNNSELWRIPSVSSLKTKTKPTASANHLDRVFQASKVMYLLHDNEILKCLNIFLQMTF